MPIDNLEEMIVRQLSDNLTTQEAEELLNWYNASEDNRKLYRDYCVLLKAQSVASGRLLFEQDRMRSWTRLKRRIRQRKPSRFRLPVVRYAAVAAVALLVGVGVHQLFDTGGTPAGGMQVTVPAGSKSQIVLPDGTSVWLNSGSRLSYTDDFGKANRTVYLDGEGFFDVTKNKRMAFEVYAGETHIRVLGTRFNMKAYAADERKRVTLLSGSLSVATDGDAHRRETILVPDEQAVIRKGSSDIEVRRVKAGNYALWAAPQKETLATAKPQADALLPQMHTPNRTFRNTLFFDEEPLEQIVKDLSRAYNVTIRLGCEEIAADIYYGDFRNEENLFQILDVITSSGEINYEVKENQIIINKNK